MQTNVNCTHATVSVIVCTTPNRDSLPATLQALAEQECSRMEVLIVISRAPQPFPIAAPAGLPVVVLHEPRAGVSRARNLALQHAQGELLFFLDDDVIPGPDWLHSLLEGFKSADVMTVTGRVLHEGAGYYPEHRYNTELAASNWELAPAQPDWFDRAMSSDAGFGCNMGFRREFLAKHRFPEDLGAGSAIGAADEYYMFLQTLASGHAMAHRAGAVVVHRYTEGEAEREKRLLQLIRSAVAFRLKLLIEGRGLRSKVIASTARKALSLLKRDPFSNNVKWNAPLSRGSVLKALLAGPMLYFCQRWRSRQ